MWGVRMAKKPARRCIGLTMDAINWKAAEVSGSPDAPRIERAAGIAVPQGLMHDGLFTNPNTALGLLGQLLSGFSKAPIIVGAKNQNVLMRMAGFPKVPEDKIRGMILYQAQKFIPLPVSELVLDCVVCGEQAAEEVHTLDVLLVGAKKTYLNQLTTLMTAAGRELLDVDSALLATTRAVIARHRDPQTPFLMMDVDHEALNMTICLEGAIKMTRTVTMPELLESLLSELQAGQSAPATIVEQAAQLLANEYQASLSYYLAQSNVNVTQAYLRTYSPATQILAQQISQRIELPVLVPPLYAEQHPEAGPVYATCISLACKGLMEVHK